MLEINKLNAKIDNKDILKGDNSVGEFYSIAITNNHQKADTGTKMTVSYTHLTLPTKWIV